LERIELLLQGLNISKDYVVNDNSLDQQLEEIYLKLFGQEKLEKAQSEGVMRDYHHCWDSILRHEISNLELPANEIKKYIDSIKNAVSRNFYYTYLIDIAIIQGNFEYVYEIINLLPATHELGQGLPKSQGYRILLKYYATVGDFENYTLILKLCEIKRKDWIELERGLLIAGLSEKKG
jgi:hypothetical protein